MKKQAVLKSTSLMPVEIIQNKIYLIRGHKVMFDRDLAELYGVTTGNLNKAVKRNMERFPSDFMYQITIQEFNSSRFQIGSLKRGQNVKYLPFVFTEQGVAMLSSVLKSKSAVQVNIQIMSSHKDLARKIEDLEKKFQEKYKEQDNKIILIFNAIRDLLADKEEDSKKKGPMGFIPPKLSETDDKSKRK